MRDLTRQRKAMLIAWEHSRAQVLEAQTREEFLFRAGGFLAISRLLNHLRHSGDGTDPIKPGEWENEALRICKDSPVITGVEVALL